MKRVTLSSVGYQESLFKKTKVKKPSKSELQASVPEESDEDREDVSKEID